MLGMDYVVITSVTRMICLMAAQASLERRGRDKKGWV